MGACDQIPHQKVGWAEIFYQINQNVRKG